MTSSAWLCFQAGLFGLLGLGLECAFTAALDAKDADNPYLLGHSSLWYVPLYAVLPLLVMQGLGHWLFTQPWPVRGLVYTALAFAFEFLGMGALRLMLGSSPSEASYFQSKWNVKGLIRLDFAPAWCVAGFLFEFVFRVLNR